jgi:hypothetical protein
MTIVEEIVTETVTEMSNTMKEIMAEEDIMEVKEGDIRRHSTSFVEAILMMFLLAVAENVVEEEKCRS